MRILLNKIDLFIANRVRKEFSSFHITFYFHINKNQITHIKQHSFVYNWWSVVMKVWTQLSVSVKN